MCQKSCKGAVKAYQDRSNPEITCPHNHAPDSVAVALDDHRNLMKTVAQETLEKPQQILSRALLQLDEEARATHPKMETVKRALRGERSANMPPEPNDLNELVIEGEWTTNGNVKNPSNFMLHDNGINAGERVIIFATEENLRRLCMWFMDGNFAMAPNLFRNGQLYVIMSQANSGVVTPEVFAL